MHSGAVLLRASSLAHPMVISLASVAVCSVFDSAIYFGICKIGSSHGNEIQTKKNLPVFLSVDTRRPVYGLKADLHFVPSKKTGFALLTCVASERSWSIKPADGNWSFKTTGAIVEHTFKSARDDLLRAEDLDLSTREKGNEANIIENGISAKASNVDAKENVANANQPVAVVSPAFSAWESVNSPRLFTTSRFALLLGVVIAIFGAVSLTGVIFQRWWYQLREGGRDEISKEQEKSWTAFGVPSSFSFFFQKDLRRKETVEWVNMVLGKLWKVYRRGLETWLVGLLQPLIDNLQKPNYVRRVEIKHFYLGDEPLSVRSVERRTSRRANDLQYHIGLRYTGEARMLLSITLSAGFLPVVIPVGVRGLDVDGEIWVKLRLIPSEPWVGTATWAFVSLPKIIMALAPFGLFNIMAIPFISRFLTKLLTEDLPQLFVRPNKIVVNFSKNQAIGPVSKEFKDNGVNVDNNKDFAGELSVTLVDARKLSYFPVGKADPHVVLLLGDQVVQSKKNSQTSIIGPPGAPIWNQDFQLLVVDPKSQKLAIRVRDKVGLTVFTVGYGEVDLSTLQDTVPVDKIVTLKGGWGPFPKRFAGEIMLRLTYKAYVDDEEEDDSRPLSRQLSDLDSDSDKDDFSARKYYRKKRRESFLSNLFGAVNTAISNSGYGNVSVEPKVLGAGSKVEPIVDEPRNPKVLDAEREVEPIVEEPRNPKLLDTERKVEPIVEEPRNPKMNSETNVPPVGKGKLVKAGKWQIQRLTENSAVMWLSLATGIALLAAVSLNFSNLLNP